MRPWHLIAIVFVSSGLAPVAAQAKSALPEDVGDPQTAVGQYGFVKGLVLPGGPWRARSVTDERTPLILRVVTTSPHGTDHRYDLQYYGLTAGSFDLGDYLESSDSVDETRLPPIPVEVRSILPEGQIRPHPLRSDRTLRLGGYRILAVAAAALWFLGLAAILLLKRTPPEHPADAARAPTLAELLRPRLEAARNGALSAREYAELERMIIEWWRRRLESVPSFVWTVT